MPRNLSLGLSPLDSGLLKHLSKSFRNRHVVQHLVNRIIQKKCLLHIAVKRVVLFLHVEEAGDAILLYPGVEINKNLEFVT